MEKKSKFPRKLKKLLQRGGGKWKKEPSLVWPTSKVEHKDRSADDNLLTGIMLGSLMNQDSPSHEPNSNTYDDTPAPDHTDYGGGDFGGGGASGDFGGGDCGGGDGGGGSD